MAKIAVHHPELPVNSGHTVFSGPAVDYRIEDCGLLRITGWETRGERGEAAFPHGVWRYVIQSWPKDPPAGIPVAA